ncbi:MAG: MFS transporter [Planctomycetota bacterium]
MTTVTPPTDITLPESASSHASRPRSATHGQTRAQDRVGLGEKLALGAGGFAKFFGEQGVKTIAIPVYQMTLAVNPMLLTIAMSIPRIWDAFSDPMMGNISDNWRSRHGRRRPFIFVGAILMGLSFALIWMVPTTWGHDAQLAYFLITSLVFFTCLTIFAVPFNSLTYELTADYHERTRIQAYPTFFSKIAEAGRDWVLPLASMIGAWMIAIGWVTAANAGDGSGAGQIADESGANLIAGIPFVGWFVGIILMAGMGVLPALFVKERFQSLVNTKHDEGDRVRFVPTLAQSLRSNAFRVLIGLTIFKIIAGMLASGLDYYVITYHMFAGDIATGTKWKAILSTGYAVVGFVSVFGMRWLASRYEKRTVLMVVYAMVVVGGVVKWFVFQPGHSPWWILLDPIMCGPIWVAVGMIMPSMLADICDEDELVSGQRREGMYGAIFTWINKSGASLSMLGMGVVLTVSGFAAERGGDQSEAAITVLRLALAGSTSLMAILAMIVLRWYPITEAKANNTRRMLEERRGAISAAS